MPKAVGGVVNARDLGLRLGVVHKKGLSPVSKAQLALQPHAVPRRLQSVGILSDDERIFPNARMAWGVDPIAKASGAQKEESFLDALEETKSQLLVALTVSMDRLRDQYKNEVLQMLRSKAVPQPEVKLPEQKDLVSKVIIEDSDDQRISDSDIGQAVAVQQQMEPEIEQDLRNSAMLQDVKVVPEPSSPAPQKVSFQDSSEGDKVLDVSPAPPSIEKRTPTVASFEQQRPRIRQAWTTSWSLEGQDTAALENTMLSTEKKARQCLPALRQNGIGRAVWNSLALLLLLWDALFTPFIIAFALPINLPILGAQGALVLFWLLDIFVSAATSYWEDPDYAHEQCEVREIRRTFIHYAKRWLVIDFLATLLDVVVLLLYMESLWYSDGVLSLVLGKLTSIRVVPWVLRAVRLIRLAKVPRLLTSLAGHFHVDAGLWLMLQSVWCPFLAALYCHFAACGFYLASSLEGSAFGWVQARASGASTSDAYLTALYWALGHMTLLTTDVIPRTYVELVYAVVITLLALVLMNMLAMRLIGSSVKLASQQQVRSANRLFLSDYIRRCEGLPWGFRSRFYSWLLLDPPKSDDPWPSGDVKTVLDLLPSELKLELKRNTALAIIAKQPFFKQLQLSFPATLWEVVCSAVEHRLPEPGEQLTLLGLADKVFFVGKGAVIYRTSKSATGRRCKQLLLAPACVGEPALWLPDWRYKGTLEVPREQHSVLELWSLDVARFSDILRTGAPSLQKATEAYTAAFSDWASDMGDELTDVNASPGMLSKFAKEAFAPPKAQSKETEAAKDVLPVRGEDPATEQPKKDGEEQPGATLVVPLEPESSPTSPTSA